MNLTPNQLKTIIIELGANENPNLDTKVMKLACLGTEIYIDCAISGGNSFPKGPQNIIFLTVPDGS